MIPRTLRFFPWLLLTLALLTGGCGGSGGGGGGGTVQNLAPVLDPIGSQVVSVGETLNLSLRASDPNLKDTVRIFNNINGDVRLSITPGNPASGTFRWTPTSADLLHNSDTPVSIQFTASDGLLEVSQTIIITVKAPTGAINHPPILGPVGNQSIIEGNTLNFTVTASDPDPGDTVTLSAIDLPPGATFVGGIFSWTPGPADLGNHNVIFRASEGLLTVEEQIVISVVPNPAPTITMTTPAPASVTENELVTVKISVIAPNIGDILTVTASGSAMEYGGAFQYDPDTGIGTFTWTPAIVTAGSFSITFAASNDTSSVAKTEIINYVRTNPLLASDITDSSLRGITMFPQTTPALDGVPELFPGQANFWDIDPDFTQFDGFWGQFDWNLSLSTDPGGFFPFDQTYADLTFMSPFLTTLDGLRVAAVAEHASYLGPDPENPIAAAPDEGTACAWLNATADSRLQQTVDLRQANVPLTLSWKDEFLVQSGAFFDDPRADTPYYRVVITDTTTGVRTVLYDGPLSDREVVETTPSRTRESRTANLSALAGKQVILSFELRGGHQLLQDANEDFYGSYARIDNVSLRDTNNSEYMVNGDFENGMTGWTANGGRQSQNLRTAPRTLGGLNITRYFYTVPNQLWARWTDVLENPTNSEITTQVIMSTDLGSDDNGIIYLDSDTTPRALTSWDGTPLDDTPPPDRDIGLVFGNINPANLSFTSASALNSLDGSDIIEIAYDVTIPAGGRVTLVHFALMSGENTGANAVDISARATTIDTEIAKILTNFRTDPRYRDGMTQSQIDTLLNF